MAHETETQRVSRKVRAHLDAKKWCSKCHTRKPLAAFPRVVSTRCHACLDSVAGPPRYPFPVRVGMRLGEGATQRESWTYPPTRGQWAMVFEGQGLACAICRRSDARRWATDHDHATGFFRGILCHACNMGIGSLGDDASRLRAAADYLDAARKLGTHGPA